jgi:alkaline phosphatase
MKRRDWLKGSMAFAAGTMLPAEAEAFAARSGEERPGVPVGRARNVIFCAYDGLTYEDIATTRFFLRRHHPGRGLLLERLLSDGSSGCMLTHSLDSIVTDSSAASAAWSTGRKIANGAVSLYPDGTELTTILELARAQGRAVGVVTTTRLTHATPACWLAKTAERDAESEIALQYLSFLPEVLLGGGSRHFDARTRQDGRDLFADFATAGYEVLLTRADLAGSSGSRLLGTFAGNHLPHEVDRRFQGVSAPSLAELSRKALEVLSGNPGGFILLVEAGRIDHANHASDPGGMLWDVIAADEALAVLMDFVRDDADTLLIVASDHATGGGGVYGSGPGYRLTDAAFDRILYHRASYERIIARLGRNSAPEQIAATIGELLGIRLSPGGLELTAEVLARSARTGHPHAHTQHPTNSLHWALTVGQEASTTPLNVNYGTSQHTAALVPVAVHGAGTGTRGLGVVDNTELFAWMLHALGAEFENPSFDGVAAQPLPLPVASPAAIPVAGSAPT